MTAHQLAFTEPDPQPPLPMGDYPRSLLEAQRGDYSKRNGATLTGRFVTSAVPNPPRHTRAIPCRTAASASVSTSGGLGQGRGDDLAS
jgi:hypothetical protein